MLTMAIVVAQQNVPRWQSGIIRSIVNDSRFRVPVVIAAETSASDGSHDLRARGMAWRLVDRVEAWWSGKLRARAGYDDPDKLLPLADVIPLTPIPARFDGGSDRRRLVMSDRCQAALEAARCDLVLMLADASVDPELLRKVPLGAWSFEKSFDRKHALGFREVLADESVTIVRVLSTSLDGRQIVRATGSYKTYRLSWEENRRRACVKGSWLMVDCMRKLADLPCNGLPGRAETAEPVDLPSHAPARDGLKATALGLLRAISTKAKSLLYRDQWQVLATTEAASGHRELLHFVPPVDRFWADPFVEADGSGAYLFVEDYDFTRSKGRIACMPLRPEAAARPKIIIESEHHHSYPFLFRADGRLYMIPECYQGGSIDLWECLEFPYRWSKKRSLIAGISAVDTTLTQWQGRWWLFTNVDRSGLRDHTAELHIFWTTDPICGEWSAHLRNPVLVDCQQARMAGGFIQLPPGRLIRLGQRTSRRYGEEFRYYEITALSPDAYEEHLLDERPPEVLAGASGAHHLSHGGGFIAVDALVERWRWPLRRQGYIRRIQEPRQIYSPPADMVARPCRAWAQT